MQDLAAGNLAAARDAADTAVKSEPGNVAALVLSGKVALAGDRPDDALRAAQAALKIVPNNAAAVLLVADSDARKGEIDPALEAYQTAWGLDHADPAPLVHASQACHAAARDTSARAFGAKAAQEFPNWAPGWAASATRSSARRRRRPRATRTARLSRSPTAPSIAAPYRRSSRLFNEAHGRR